MSELFTQTNKQKKLFRTEEDIVANIQTQFGMPHTGKDLLLDSIPILTYRKACTIR